MRKGGYRSDVRGVTPSPLPLPFPAPPFPCPRLALALPPHGSKAARVGGLERAASPAEECGREKAKPPPARSGGAGGAGGGRRWSQDRGKLAGAKGGGGGWMAGGYLGHRASLADGWRSNVWGIGELRRARMIGRGKSGGSTTLLPIWAAPLRYARRGRTKKGHSIR